MRFRMGEKVCFLHPRAKVHQFMYYYMGRLYVHPTNLMGVSVL